jgi:uncharacterized protein
MKLYVLAVGQPKKMLQTLSGWLDLAEKHAEAAGFSPDAYLASRLAVDQFPLVRQIQSTCDGAKFTPARLTGKTPPSHPDTETTLVELKARIASTIAYLDTFAPADFEGAEEREIELPRSGGKKMLGGAYVVEFAQPNFYFHITHTYGLLRKDGLPLGKLTFLGPLSFV